MRFRGTGNRKLQTVGLLFDLVHSSLFTVHSSRFTVPGLRLRCHPAANSFRFTF